MRTYASGDKTFAIQIFGIKREAFAENETTRVGFGLEFGDLRPGGFGIDVIFRDRRNSTPVVDACVEQAREIGVAQVWWSLNIHLGAENQARDGDSPQHVVHR